MRASSAGQLLLCQQEPATGREALRSSADQCATIAASTKDVRGSTHQSGTHHASIHVEDAVPNVRQQAGVPGVTHVPLQVPQQRLQSR